MPMYPPIPNLVRRRNEIPTVVPVRLMRIFQISIWQRRTQSAHLSAYFHGNDVGSVFLLKSQTRTAAAETDGRAAVRNKAFQMT